MYRTVKLTALKAWLQERQYAAPYHWRQRPNDEREYQLRTAVVLELAGLSAAAHSAARLLDVGCGDGRFTAAAAQHARATGVDVSHRALMFGRTLVPNARFVRSGGERLPFASNSFDVVTILDVIEHIPDDYEAHVIGESYRVLRSGGRLIVSTNTDRSRCELKHYRHYSVARFRSLFDRFADVRMTGIIPYFPTLRFWMAAPLARRAAAARIRTCAPADAQVVVGVGSK